MITKYGYLKLKERYKSGYRWIARDKDGCLYIYYREPKRLVYSWDTERGCSEWSVNDDLLQCIKWEDEKPTRIDDLIRDYESHQIITSEKVKVTVPQFIAHWIEEAKTKYTLKGLFASKDMPNEVKSWLFCNNRNCELMARAWLDGFMVDKEKLYTVRLANGSCLYKFELSGINWTQEYSNYEKDIHCQLTQSEIESVDPRLMQFAEEVE